MPCPLRDTHPGVGGCEGPFWRGRQLHAANRSGEVRSGTSALSVVQASDFVSVRKFDAPAEGTACDARSGSAPRLTARHVHHIALSVDVCQGFSPSVYGHVWATLYAVYCWQILGWH